MLFGYDLYALWKQGKKKITNCFERSWPWLRKQFSSVRKQVISKMSLDLVQGVQLRRKFPKKMLMILLQILHNSNCAVMDPTRNGKFSFSEGLLENIPSKFYLFVPMLCLCCCARLSLVAGHRLLTVVASLVAEHWLWGTEPSVVVVCGLYCPVAGGIFPDQGSNPCCLHWMVDS